MSLASRLSLLALPLGAAAVSAFGLSPAALADPADTHDPANSPLVSTTCSADQILEATQHEAPKFWDRFGSDQEKLDKFHDRLQTFLDKSPEDRAEGLKEFKAKAAKFAEQHPEKAKQFQAHKGEMHATIERVLDTCGQY